VSKILNRLHFIAQETNCWQDCNCWLWSTCRLVHL